MGYTVKRASLRTVLKGVFSADWENSVIKVNGNELIIRHWNGKKRNILMSEIDEKRVDVLEKGLYSPLGVIVMAWLLGLAWTIYYYGAKYIFRKVFSKPKKKVVRKITYFSKGEELFSIHTKMKNAKRLEEEIGILSEWGGSIEAPLKEEMPEDAPFLNHFNEEVEAKNYLNKNLKGKRNRGIICLSILLVLWINIISNTEGDKLEEAKKYNNMNADTKTLYYEDIILVSGTVHSRLSGYYYLAQNTEGQWLLVCMDDEMHRELKAQYEYYVAYHKGEAGIQPEPVRIYGVSEDSSIVFEDEIAKMGEEEFINYFGKCYLNTKKYPGEEREKKEIFVLVFFVIMLVAMLSFRIMRGHKRKKCIESLEERGLLVSAANELYIYGGLIVKDGTKCSPHFLYSYYAECIIPVTDILWSYRVVVLKEKKEKLIVYTGKSEGIAVYVEDIRKRKNKSKEIAKVDIIDLTNRIKKYNQNVLLGYSEENKHEYYIRRQ